MFVLRSTHNRIVRQKDEMIRELNLKLEQLTEKQLESVEKKVEKVKENEVTLDNTLLEFEETPIPQAVLTSKGTPRKLKMPARSEAEERLQKAIDMFQKRHNRSYVQKRLDVSRKTAKRYLDIALQKRKIKKADYEALNK